MANQTVISSSHFKSALALACKQTDPKSHVPALGDVRLTTLTPQELLFSASDLDSWVWARVPCLATSAINIAVSAKALTAAVKGTRKNDEFMLTQTPNGCLRVAWGATECLIPKSTERGDWLNEPSLATETTSVLQSAVVEGIEAVSYAASADQARYALTVVHMEAAASKYEVSFVATDGYRLAVCQRDLAGKRMIPGLDEEGVNIPIKAARLIAIGLNWAQDDSATCRFGLTLTEPKTPEPDATKKKPKAPRPEALTFRTDDGRFVLWTRLIDEAFPQYRRVVPSDDSAEIVASTEREPWRKAVEQLASMPNQGHSVVHHWSDTLKLSAESPDGQKNNAEVPAITTKQHGPVTKYDKTIEAVLAYNGRYLAEALGAMAGQQVEVRVTYRAPLKLWSPDDPKTVACIMPQLN